jgi:hypothetical protein
MSSLIHVSFSKVYLYKGVTFEWSGMWGPVILRRNTEVVRDVRNISLRIWGLINQFDNLSTEDKEEYRII